MPALAGFKNKTKRQRGRRWIREEEAEEAEEDEEEEAEEDKEGEEENKEEEDKEGKKNTKEMMTKKKKKKKEEGLIAWDVLLFNGNKQAAHLHTIGAKPDLLLVFGF